MQSKTKSARRSDAEGTGSLGDSPWDGKAACGLSSFVSSVADPFGAGLWKARLPSSIGNLGVSFSAEPVDWVCSLLSSSWGHGIVLQLFGVPMLLPFVGVIRRLTGVATDPPETGEASNVEAKLCGSIGDKRDWNPTGECKLVHR